MRVLSRWRSRMRVIVAAIFCAVFTLLLTWGPGTYDAVTPDHSLLSRWWNWLPFYYGQAWETQEPSIERLRTVYPPRLAVDFLPSILTAPTIDITSSEYVVYIKNRPQSSDKRSMYRERRAELFGANPMVFVIGTTDDPEIEARLASESTQFGDILIGDYPDDYQSLRQKDFMRLQHFVEFADAPASLMIDDDVTPQISPRVVRSLLWNNNKVHCMFRQWDYSAPFRDIESRWFTTVEEYPLTYFPSYCAGPCFALGRTAAEDIFNAAKTHEWTPIGSKSDVYVTGIMRRLSGTGLITFGHICPGHTDLIGGYQK